MIHVKYSCGECGFGEVVWEGASYYWSKGGERLPVLDRPRCELLATLSLGCSSFDDAVRKGHYHASDGIHVCLDCARVYYHDPNRAAEQCPLCGSSAVDDVSLVAGEECFNCGEGTVTRTVLPPTATDFSWWFGFSSEGTRQTARDSWGETAIGAGVTRRCENVQQFVDAFVKNNAPKCWLVGLYGVCQAGTTPPVLVARGDLVAEAEKDRDAARIADRLMEKYQQSPGEVLHAVLGASDCADSTAGIDTAERRFAVTCCLVRKLDGRIVSAEEALGVVFLVDVREREKRARTVQVVAEGGGVYLARGRSGSDYTIDINAATCTCEDYRRNGPRQGMHCKHLIAAMEMADRWAPLSGAIARRLEVNRRPPAQPVGPSPSTANVDDLRAEARECVKRYMEKATELYGSELPMPTITFDLHGTSAGQANGHAWRIRLNPILMKENAEEFLAQTVPHEVAHLVASRLFNAHGHSSRWKKVMHDFGLEPERCHTFDTTRSRTSKPRRFAYHCACQEHMLTSIRHNRILRGTAQYRCARCNEVLVRSREAAQDATPGRL